MSELERLLELANAEPAHGPAFFRALLSSDVFALVPSGQMFSSRGNVCYVMWKGADEGQVIPFFTSQTVVRRVLTKETQALRVNGKTFLKSCLGATVVLNPNESASCKLTPHEVRCLVATGLPDAAVAYVKTDQEIELRSPAVPEPLLESLRILLSQHPAVECAYLVSFSHRGETAPAAWLVAVRTERAVDVERIASEVSGVMTCLLPEHSVDLMQIAPGSQTDNEFRRALLPFYTQIPDRTSELGALLH